MITSLTSHRSVVALSLAALASTACGGSSGAGPQSYATVQSSLARNVSPQVAPADLEKLAADNTAFAYSLYHAVATDDGSNLFYSPYSISLVLAMTYAGASGSTATQMASALDFAQPPATLDAAFDAIDLALAMRAQDPADDGLTPFKLNVADSLWADRSMTFEQSFLDTLAVNYGAGVRTVDFQGAPDASRATINGWVSDETDALIPQLLRPNDITSDTSFVLVNAIYFNAGWATPFDAPNTQPAPFHRLDGSTTTPPTMQEYVETGYASGAGWQAVELPYAGGQTSMVVIVPDAGQFGGVEAQLSGDFVSTLEAGLSTADVVLSMPKFAIQGSTISLKAELTKLGMVDAFDGAANFSAMSKQSIVLSDVLHQAFVKVDEMGTQAAAATAVIGIATSAASKQVTLAIDRPFLFFLRDIPTNTVLFAGRVVDPG